MDIISRMSIVLFVVSAAVSGAAARVVGDSLITKLSINRLEVLDGLILGDFPAE